VCLPVKISAPPPSHTNDSAYPIKAEVDAVLEAADQIIGTDNRLNFSIGGSVCRRGASATAIALVSGPNNLVPLPNIWLSRTEFAS
jgi:hypothetical protein